MSLSQRTDMPHARPARWRSPAGWPLRTRLVAIIMLLLTVLCIAVGGTAELSLRQTLYHGVNLQVSEITRRVFGGPRHDNDMTSSVANPPPDVSSGSVVVFLSLSGGTASLE